MNCILRSWRTHLPPPTHTKVTVCVTFGTVIHELHWRIAFGFGALPALALLLCGIGGAGAGAGAHEASASASASASAGGAREGRTVLETSSSSSSSAAGAAAAGAAGAGAAGAAAAAAIGVPAKPSQPCDNVSRLMRRPYLELLLGTSLSWFLSDLIFYGNFFLQAYIVDQLMSKGPYADGSSFSINFIAQVGVACNSMFWLGGLCSVYRLRSISALALQLQGFALAAVMLFAVAAAKALLSEANWHTNVALYVLTWFAPGYGPAPTTFLMPSLLFPSKLRLTANGIAAAAGKLGAAACVAIVLLGKVDLANLLALYGSMALLGAGTTMMLLKVYMKASRSSARRLDSGHDLYGRDRDRGRGRGAFEWSTRIRSDDEEEADDRSRLLPQEGLGYM